VTLLAAGLDYHDGAVLMYLSQAGCGSALEDPLEVDSRRGLAGTAWLIESFSTSGSPVVHAIICIVLEGLQVDELV
jgi:hypothetical protein